MNKPSIYLFSAALIAALAGCTPPEKDVPGLTADIENVIAGPYGQSIYHEELAEEKLEEANNVLNHWENDHYWNIDERQKGLDAAKEAAQHRHESERALCQWLTEAHGQNHHHKEKIRRTAAYFKTGSAVPYRTDHHHIAMLGKYLQAHPDATAEIVAYTDTVGSAQSNQRLSERRAEAVSQLLIEHGARAEQLRTSAQGEARGPDNKPNKHHRKVTISTAHPGYVDCPNLK